jgi:LysM repeat protein
LLYLQPKRDKAEPGNETHTAAEGETLYSISQKYGVKLKKLYEYNRMADGDKPVAGQMIWLRAVKPVN